MNDQRLVSALRSLEPDVDAVATDRALREVERTARVRRGRRRATAVIGAAAAVALFAGAISVLGDDDSSEQSVVVDSPTATTSANPPTTAPSPTSTTVAVITPTTGVGTIDDLASGVTGLELQTWFSSEFEDPESWQGFWRADDALAQEVAAAIVASGVGAVPEPADRATMRFELPDGRVVFVEVDLESGWVAGGQQLPEDLTRQLRTGFNDAVGRPWENVDVFGPYVARIIARAGFPIDDLATIAAQVDSNFDQGADRDAERWFVELVEDGPEPVLEVRERGVGDDSARGSDVRLLLVETSDGWQVESATVRALCLRGVPSATTGGGCI
jgi:hypothetical protein